MRTGAAQRDAGAGRNRRIAPCDTATDIGRPVSGVDAMMLFRALHSESLKMKRTIALKMVVLSPAVVVLLILFVTSQGPFSTLNRNGLGNKWMVLTSLTLKA